MNRTIVDWLGFRSRASVGATVKALRGVYGPLGGEINVRPRAGGWMGYEHSAEVHLADMTVGLVAYGGVAQRDWVMGSVSGRGCAWIDDWDRAQDALGELSGYQPRRVDIALDTRGGEVGHNAVVAAYRQGLFSTGGRPPSMHRIEPEDPREGRTVYVGNRERPKFLRGYEKGYELVKGLRTDIEITHIDGAPIELLYRLELELKAKDAPLPVDLIDRRDQYFAGAYPYLSHVLRVEPEIFVQRRERGPQLQLEAALSVIRQQYGRTLFTALAAYQGDITAVWDRIVGKKHSDALLAAGVLLVSHD